MSIYDDDITMMFEGPDSKVITLGAYTTNGFVDSAEELVLEQDNRGGVIVNAQIVTIKTGVLVGLAIGSIITVDGVSKTVRQRLKIDDGALTTVLVSG